MTKTAAVAEMASLLRSTGRGACAEGLATASYADCGFPRVGHWAVSKVLEAAGVVGVYVVAVEALVALAAATAVMVVVLVVVVAAVGGDKELDGGW